jgi:hypothetical protein
MDLFSLNSEQLTGLIEVTSDDICDYPPSSPVRGLDLSGYKVL